MDSRLLCDYVFSRGIDRVSGWLGDGAVSLVLAISQWQRTHDVSGDVAEIGVHHGKFFILLKNTCAPNETAFAIDVFRAQELNPDGSGKGDLEIFERNLALHTNNDNIKILQKDSLTLTPYDFRHQNKSPRVRLFSVDGSHTAGHTFNDLNIATSVLAPGGLVILDDYTNPAWPGVGEGFHKFMFQRSAEFAALAYGENKMLVCRAGDHSQLLRFIKDEVSPFARWSKAVTLHGRAAVALAMKPPDDTFDADLRLHRRLLPNSDIPCHLLAGWGRLEPRGAWTVSETAELELEFDEPIRELELVVHPYLPDPRRSRRMVVLLGERVLAEDAIAGPRSVIVKLPEKASERAMLVIQVEAPDRPADLGGTDRRKLGFFLSGIRVPKAAGDT